jgi:hypothetical protein
VFKDLRKQASTGSKQSTTVASEHAMFKREVKPREVTDKHPGLGWRKCLRANATQTEPTELPGE